ncbi:DUF6270 domain-containing protein [Pasteurella testudinis]|uniref:DUF6270 domain-containing protein n=1 Tax=Pasteurella testudinis TaxID=761 RepID=UPI004059753C
MKIVIFGSCVTRDAFTFDQDDEFNLVRYFARSSLATAFDSAPIEDEYTSQLSSPFQRKIVNADLSKEFAKIIQTTEFDSLIVDFIDDRYDIFKFHTGEKILLSAEIQQTDFLEKCKTKGEVIAAFSEKWFAEWERGYQEFYQVMKSIGALSKIVLNKVYWTDIVDDGTIIQHSSRLEVANCFLKRQYERIEADLSSNVLNYPEQLVAKKKHIWGLSPFHYVDGVYQHLLTELRVKKKKCNKVIKK